MTEKRLSWFYYFGRWLMVLVLRLLSRWEVRGKENVPPEGSLLVVSNHLQAADPPLVAVSVPRKTIFMAKQELFVNPIIRYFISNFGAFPVNRMAADRKALHRAKEVLNSGWCLVMFPEGKRSRTASLREAFPGSVLIATQNKANILPVGITGTERLTSWKWIFQRPRITVTIGRPFTLHPANGSLTKEELTELTDDLMVRIAELLPEKYHGAYTEKVVRR